MVEPHDCDIVGGTAVVIDVDDRDFRTALDSHDLAVVHFYARWCGCCVLFHAAFDRVARALPRIAFLRCDGEDAPRSRQTVYLDDLPYFALYRYGRQIDGFSTTDENALRARIETRFALAQVPEAAR